MTERERIAISACLLGRRCRYDGRVRKSESWIARAGAGDTEFVPVCPEELGGLGTPRPAAEIEGGDAQSVLDEGARVVAAGGRDVTSEFVEGARAALEIARAAGARRAVLKSRSPSCGCGQISTSRGVVEGNGIFAELCLRDGIEVEPAEFDDASVPSADAEGEA